MSEGGSPELNTRFIASAYLFEQVAAHARQQVIVPQSEELFKKAFTVVPSS